MGDIAAANVILALFALKPTEDESDQGEATIQKGKVRVKKNFGTKWT